MSSLKSRQLQGTPESRRRQALMRYPSEALSAILESIPAVEMALTLVALALGLWLLTQIVAALPEGSQA